MQVLSKNDLLIELLETLVLENGTIQTDIASLSLSKITAASEFACSMYEPSVYFVARGIKEVYLAERTYTYDASTYMISSVHLPLSGKIVQASKESSYLALKLTFNIDEIMEVVQESASARNPLCIKQCDCALVLGKMDEALLDALIRLVSLLKTPKLISLLSPLIIKEILYRLLDHHPHMFIKQFAMIGSYAQRIMQAIHLINTHFSEPLRISDMAHSLGMSNSLFHRHFKKVTTLTPIQYQKKVRLQMARKLLLTQQVDAANASFQVGYASPSHFSREYARMYGAPPKTDTKYSNNVL
ncbi:MAG: AraC family transcriptional regulator [Sulfurospirillaceae bacterium]|nr:AraC family transcriptional regulator [Sulfurospirillaceae bacterium]